MHHLPRCQRNYKQCPVFPIINSMRNTSHWLQADVQISQNHFPRSFTICFPHTRLIYKDTLVLSDKVGHTSGLFSASGIILCPLSHLMHLSAGLWILREETVIYSSFYRVSLTFSHAARVSPYHQASFTEDLTDKIIAVKTTADFPDDTVVKTSPSNV